MRISVTKVGKSTVSILLAVIMVAVSMFTACLNISAEEATGKQTVKWTITFPITTDAAFVESITEGDGTSNNPYIITTPEQLAYLSASAGDNSIGKYYKVADDIAAFDMTQYSIDATAQGVLAGVNESWNKWYQNANTSPFQGNFDGNGVVIYGIQGTSWQTGLFPHVKNATIKNLGVQASYFKSSGNNGSAAIVGRTSGTLTVENCSVKNCYITSAGSGPLGTILGGTGNNNHIIIKNCFVSGNIVTESTNYVYGGITSGGYTQPSDYEFSNIVAVGNNVVATIPDGVSGGLVNVTDTSCYTDSYTDQATDSTYTGITVLTTEQMTGANAITNMSALDFDNAWFAVNGGIPELRAFHLLSLTDNGDGTHTEICSKCDIKGVATNHNYVVNTELGKSVCACGATKNSIELTWDGTIATSFASTATGAANDPIIISTPAELAYLALSTTLDSAGKYYKVVDNAVFNMDGMQGVDRTSNASTVKNATKNTDRNWAGDGAKFSGNFDGNGLVIYNLYSKGAYNGLFPNMTTNNGDNSCTIKNVTVLSSYISGYHYSGGIIGAANASTVSQSLTLENCAVENCFISDNGNTNSVCNRTSGAFIGSVAHNGGTISNCLAKNNDTSATDITGGFIGTSSNYGSAVVIKNSVSIGTLPYSTVTEGSTKTIGTKCNQPGDYTNVYTDQTVDSSFTGVTTLTADQMTGENAKTNMSALDFDSTWFAANDSTPELRISHSIVGVSNGASGHIEACEDSCGLIGFEVPHTFVNNKTEQMKTCIVCGYSEPFTIGSTDTWNWDSSLDVAPYYGYGDPNMDGSGTEADPYIITTSEQLAAVALWGGDDTADKYYKVSDDVDVLYLTPNTDSYDNSSMDALKTSLTAEKDSNNATIKTWTTNTNYIFQGHFDGNGVVIRGMSSYGQPHGGLFPYIMGDVSIKNVIIEDSYVSGSTNVGVISGGINPNGASDQLSDITIENCAIRNNYVELQSRTSYSKGWGSVGGAIGWVGKVTGSVTINNCYVADNNIVNPGTQTTRAFFGGISQNGVSNGSGGYDWPTVISIKNSITDLCPYNTDQYTNQVAYFSNIYTTSDVTSATVGTFTDDNIKIVTSSDMTGVAARVAMTGLDWGNIWWINEGAPELRIFHDIVFVYVNETVHISSCNDDDCKVIGIEEPHNFVTTGNRNDCVNCGYSEISGETADDKYYIDLIKRGVNDEELYYWNNAGSEIPSSYNHVGGYGINTKYNAGEFEEWNLLDGSGTAEDPYVISDALTLYRIIASGGTDLGVPQHFIIDRDIDLATDLKTGETGKSYQWVKLESAKTGTNVICSYHAFAGILDGNGHTITGLYTKTDEAAAGFIPQLAAGGEIRDLHIRGGIAVTTNGSAGILVGTAEAGSVISGCSVENGTAAGTNGSGMLVGYGSATIKNSYFISTNGSGYYDASGNSVDAAAISTDYTGNNGTTAVWYKGGSEDSAPKLVSRALVMQCADVDGDGDGDEYTAADLTSLKSRLLRKSAYANVYGDVSHNGKIDVRDLVIMQREIVNDGIDVYDGFWRNANNGKFEVFYTNTDNYDSARKVQLFMQESINADVNKTKGKGDNNFDIVIETSSSLGEADYSVSYDIDNAVLKISGGSSTAVEEAVLMFVNGSDKSNGVVYTGSGTIPDYKSSVTLDATISSDKYYYVWGDEFNYDDAAVVNGNHTINYGKWNIRNKSTDDGNYGTGYIDVRESTRTEATEVNEVTSNGELKLKRGYDSDKKYYISGIGTQGTMLFKHGYMEIVAEIPDDGFSFPAWWLMTNAGYNNRAVAKSLYGKVYELNPDYKETIYFDPTDYTTYKYKLPTHTTETDIWEVIQKPGINTSGFISKTYTLTPSTRKTLYVGLHKWYPYSASRTGDVTLYDLDWNNVKSNGGFKSIDTSKFEYVSQYGSYSTLAENVSKYSRGYDNNYKQTITDEAAAGITELKYVYGSSAVSNNHLAKRRYGFLWNGSKIVFMAYDGVASDAKLLYQRTVDLADMNYDGVDFVDQYAYVLLENHIFTSASKNGNGRSLNNYDGKGNAYSGSPYTTDMTIDYVRLYQLEGERDIVTNDTEAFNSNNRWSSSIYN